MRAVLLVALGGCWSSPAPPPMTAPTEPAPKAIATAPPAHRSTMWKGRYVCAQGPTALELEIASGDHAIDATFTFGPLPENPNVPHGAYKMHGTVTRLGDGEFAVILEPDHWLEQPPSYVMVGLQAATSAEHSVLRGKITNPSCAEIELSRVR